MKRLEKRVALVTGAASGIGKAIAQRLGEEGCAVLVTDIQDKDGAQVAAQVLSAGVPAVYQHLDVTSEKDWTEALARIERELGGMDILVNNAGVGDLGTLEDTGYAAYKRTIAITQDSVYLGMHLGARLLLEAGQRKRGSVINIASVFGASGGFGTSPAYHAAKGAVRLLTKNVALLWAMKGVRVNSVHPGFIDTPILAGTKGTPFEQAMMALTPMSRLGTPAEVASAVAWLASDEASFVTGSEVYVDGGYMAR